MKMPCTTYQIRPCYVNITFSFHTVLHKILQVVSTNTHCPPTSSTMIKMGGNTSLSVQPLSQMLLPAAHRFNSSSRLCTAPCCHTGQAHPTGTHWHSLVVTWGDHWSLQLFTEGHSFQGPRANWLLPSRPSSPQQVRRVGVDGDLRDGLTVHRKNPQPRWQLSACGARPGVGPWGEGRMAGNPPHTPPPARKAVPKHYWGQLQIILYSRSLRLITLQDGWHSSQIPVSKILLLCLLASKRELSVPPKGTGWQATSGVLGPRWQMLGHPSRTPKVPLADTPEPEPVTAFSPLGGQMIGLAHSQFWNFTSQNHKSKIWIPPTRVPSPQSPLLANAYFFAIFHSNLAFAKFKLDCITNWRGPGRNPPFC